MVSACQSISPTVFLSTPSARRATLDGLQPKAFIAEFLSTPSARRATVPLIDGADTLRDFYPRPPRGGRRPLGRYIAPAIVISIHALREEGDLRIPACGSGCRYFYPRPPRGGRPCALPLLSPSLPISIHALREEGDPRQTTSRKLVGNFYPRPPRGGRPPPFLTHCRNGQFLSTPSARRATYASRSRDGGTGDFYPRPPRGGRL